MSEAGTAGEERSRPAVSSIAPGDVTAAGVAERSIDWLVLAGGIVGSAFGVVGLLGWVFDASDLRTFGSADSLMVPWTAVGVLGLGVALACHLRVERDDSRLRQLVMFGSAATALLIGMVASAEHVTGLDFGVDSLLWHSAVHAASVARFPGRPSVQTAASLVLLGAAELLWLGRRQLCGTAALCATAGGSLGALGLFGHILDLQPLFSSNEVGAPGLSVPSACAVLVLGASIALGAIERQLVIFASQRASARVIHVLLPAVIIVPMLAAAAEVRAVGRGDAVQVLSSVVSVVGIAVLVGLVWRAAAALHDRDQERQQLLVGLDAARVAADAANRSKSQFLSRMSHELRTPLNAVLGYAQLLELEPLPGDQQHSVGQIIKGGHHLLSLISEVIDISRIEAGELALSLEPVLVSDVIDDVLDLTRPIATQSSIRLDREARGGCERYALADRQRLQQILLNLVSNGIKYNRPDGTVSVSCQAGNESSVLIEVADTGAGIPPEQLDLLFAPFERLGAEHTAVEGTGIGLALSRRLAEAMNGSLDVVSTLGKGSVFRIELPVAEKPAQGHGEANEPARAREAPSHSIQDHAVLYVEDNLVNVGLVERVMLQRRSLRVIPVMQGRLAVEMAQEIHPTLVLLDLHLPDMQGEDVLRELKHHPTTASIPVVVVSADATRSQIERVVDAGAHAYLTKPLDVRELLAIVDDVIAHAAWPA